MTAAKTYENNKLVRSTILRMYPSSFAANLTTSIALMVDTIMAGALIGKEAIAAVAIGLPAIGIFQALTQAITNGATVKMAVHAGRGDQKAMDESYSLGLASAVTLGLFFILVCLTMADKLAMIFGGAKNPHAAQQAALFLRACSIRILMGSLNMFINKIYALFGHQKMVLRSALIALVGSIVFSILYVHLLPAEIKILGIAVGAWSGGLCALLNGMLMRKKYNIPLRFRLKDVHLKDLPGILRAGFPTSGNMLADNAISGVVNNIIVSGFGGDTLPLSVYAAVKGVISFALTPATGATMAASPLLGILYGSRDRSGILRTVKESYKIGLVVSVVWSGILVAVLPLLERFYSMHGIPEFSSGVIVCLLFIPLLLLMRIFTQVFESMEKTAMGLLYSIVPDSIIYPLVLALLLPLLGYNGVWISYGANAIPFLVILFLLRSLKNHSSKMSMDRLLCLDKAIRDNVPKLDISITAQNSSVTGISQQVHAFLQEEGFTQRTAYMASLCLEELAADFVAHTEEQKTEAADRTIMDIKLFADTDSLQIIIRNIAAPYNPLEFELDDQSFSKAGVKLVQKLARRIHYNYVYHMNIVTIEIDK